MKLISWNVNGVRACINKGFLDYLEKENPDTICLQETKAREDQLEKKDIIKIRELGYHIYWNPAKRPGYSGTAIFSKEEPLTEYRGINTHYLDLDEVETDEVIEENQEGRVITLEFNNFYIINVYTPNAKRDLERLDYRQVWDRVFLKYINYLENMKPVILCGDLNVAHKEIDLKNPKSNKRNAGFTDEERQGMTEYIESGYIDTFRYFYPDTEGAYSWWSYMGKARSNNTGWRIDYWLASPKLKNNLKDAFIRPEIMGSDHCPVGLEIDI